MNFVDLPGYGYAKAAKSEKLRWAELMEGFFGSERNIALVVQLIDSRHKPSKDDYDMLNFLKSGGYKTVIALTKIDKLNKPSALNALKRSKQNSPISRIMRLSRSLRRPARVWIRSEK